MSEITCCENPGVPMPNNCFLCKGAFCSNCLVVMEGKEICLKCYKLAQKEMHNEVAETSHIVLGLVGGLVVAIASAVIWAIIVIKTGYINGLFALGVGLLTGFCVHLSAGRRRSFGLQIVAVSCAAFAILLGQLLTAAGQIGIAAKAEQGDQFTWFNPALLTVTIEHYGEFFDYFYLIMIPIACYYAWSFNKPRVS